MKLSTFYDVTKSNNRLNWNYLSISRILSDEAVSCSWTTTPMILHDQEEWKPIRRVGVKIRSLRGRSRQKDNPRLNSHYVAIGNRIFFVTQSALGFFYQSANMGTSVAVCLVFIGCCSNVVFLELLVRSVIEFNFSSYFYFTIWLSTVQAIITRNSVVFITIVFLKKQTNLMFPELCMAYIDAKYNTNYILG